MKELLLTDSEAKSLIKIIKAIATKHNRTLTNRSSGTIDLVGQNNTRFILNYFYSTTSKVFHLRETQHNYTLLRINLNNKFHKNANGEKVWGNRVNIFSEEEYYQKETKQLITKLISFRMKIFQTPTISWICLRIYLIIPT